MSVLPVSASSPIEVSSSDVCSPRAITISSNSSPIRASDTFLYSQVPYWTDHSISLGSSGLPSRIASPAAVPRTPGVHSTRTSHPANISRPNDVSRSMLGSHSVATSHSTIPAHYTNIELELVQLREQCNTLHTENSELKGKVEALRYVSILCYTDAIENTLQNDISVSHRNYGSQDRQNQV